MAWTKRRYGKEEFARRGDEIYQTKVVPQLSADDKGKFAAIDIDSGSYELEANELKACDKLNARIPSAQIWLVRVGSPYVHRFVRCRESDLLPRDQSKIQNRKSKIA